MPTNATNSGSPTLSLAAIVLSSSSLPMHILQRLTLLRRNPDSEPSLPSCSGLHLSIRFRSKARPAARDSDFKHRVFGVKTRNRGTPPTASIVGSRPKPSSAFVRTADAEFSVPGRKQISEHLGASLLLMQGKGAPFPCTPSPKPRICTHRKNRCCCGNLMLEFLRSDQL
jgi:hypothetical protein